MRDLFCFETTLGTVLILEEPSGTQVWSPLASVLKLASGCGTLVKIIKEPQVAFVDVGVYLSIFAILETKIEIQKIFTDIF